MHNKLCTPPISHLHLDSSWKNLFPDLLTHICYNFPIGSRELCNLKSVEKRLCVLIDGIFQSNMAHILSNYFDLGTPIDRILSDAKKYHHHYKCLPLKTVFVIQKSIIDGFKASCIPCLNRQLALTEISEKSQQMNSNLNAIWKHIHHKVANSVSEFPTNTSAEWIRTWVNANPARLQNITKLNLQYFSLTGVPEEIGLMKNVQMLELDYNRLTYLSENVFGQLTQLKMLSFGHNRLSHLPENIFSRLTQLKYLKLNHNNLSHISAKVFSHLNDLSTVKLNGNKRLLFCCDDEGTEMISLNPIRKFQWYVCRSQFADFYQDVAFDKSLDTLRASFSALDREAFQKPLFEMVYHLAQPSTRDKQWEENHIFDDMGIFCEALKRFVQTKFESLSLEDKNTVYAYVTKLALEDEDITLDSEDEDPHWGDCNATSNVLRLIDAMESLREVQIKY